MNLQYHAVQMIINFLPSFVYFPHPSRQRSLSGRRRHRRPPQERKGGAQCRVVPALGSCEEENLFRVPSSSSVGEGPKGKTSDPGRPVIVIVRTAIRDGEDSENPSFFSCAADSLICLCVLSSGRLLHGTVSSAVELHRIANEDVRR